jgi:hypothetical protein
MYTDMFRNIARYEILEVDRSQISEITKTIKLPKIALHSLFVSLSTFVKLHFIYDDTSTTFTKQPSDDESNCYRFVLLINEHLS